MSDSGDEDLFDPTQTEENIEVQLRSKYGEYPKDIFKQRIVDALDVDNLHHIRGAMYDLCVRDVPSTPQGTLIARKHTTRSGGKSLAYKIADDIFQLYHYYHGDISVDLVKLLNERSRANHLKNTNNEDGVSVTASETEQSQWDGSLKNFCVDLLKQMREDRDIILKEIRSYKEENLELKQSIKRITNELKDERDKREKMQKMWDTDVKEMQKKVDDIRVFRAAAEAEIRGLQGSVNTRMSNMDSRITNAEKQNKQDVFARFQNHSDEMEKRLQAQIDLSVKQIHTVATIIRAPPPVPKESRHVREIVDNGHTGKFLPACPPPVPTASSSNHSGQQTPGAGSAKPLVNIPQPPTGPRDDGGTRGGAAPPVEMPLRAPHSRDAQVSFGFWKDDTDSGQDTLEGFTTVRKRRSEYAYVGNIKLKTDSDNTKNCVCMYLEQRNIDVHKCQILRTNDNTMSMKIAVAKGESDAIYQDSFWPEGIYCRSWRRQ